MSEAARKQNGQVCIQSAVWNASVCGWLWLQPEAGRFVNAEDSRSGV